MKVIIIGSGHYVTGQNVLLGKQATDKDIGVILPVVVQLYNVGIVSEIEVVGRNGTKIDRTIRAWKDRFGDSNININTYPPLNVVDECAYNKTISKSKADTVALIAVPDRMHKEVIMSCIKSNINFFVVKPAVIRLNEYLDLVKYADQNNVLGYVDYHKIFDDQNIMLKNDIDKGLYGSIQHIYSIQTQKRSMLTIYSDEIRGNKSFNVNHYLGSHYIHLTAYLTLGTPISVRAVGQKGVCSKLYNNDCYDLIQTQVEWISSKGEKYISYHVAGWNDPNESPTMSRQKYQLIGTNGSVDANQDYRGLSKNIEGEGYSTPNPHYFNIQESPDIEGNFVSQYGARSIETFIKLMKECLSGNKNTENIINRLPTLSESLHVTKILDAADCSLRDKSSIIIID